MPGIVVAGPDAITRVPKLVACAVIAAMGVTAILGWPNVSRPGYILDEEITIAVAPSVSQHGIPTLPSGLVYLRGLPYTYLAWLSGLPFGHSLATYRSLSLLCALIGIVAWFLAARALAGPAAGAIAAVLLASNPVYLAVAAFARPYSLFIAAFGITVWAFVRAREGRLRYEWFYAGLVVCRLLHELGLTLVLLPLASAAMEPQVSDRGHRLSPFWKAAILAAALELLLYGAVQASLVRLFTPLANAPAFRPVRLPPLPPLHLFEVATPVSFFVLVALPLAALAWLLIRRMHQWFFVLCCTVFGMLFLLGPMLALLGLAIILRPHRARTYAAVASLMFFASATAWTLHTFARTYVQPAWRVPYSLVTGVLHYPFGALRYLGEQWPVTIAAAAIGLVSVLRRDTHDPSAGAARILASFAGAVVVSFGVLSINLQPRFLLLILPPILMLAADGLRRVASGATLVLLIGIVATAQSLWQQEEPLRSIAPLGGVSATDRIICSEELACRYLIGRVDYLLLANPVDLAYYAGRRDGELRGLYAGSPVLSTETDLERVIRDSVDDRRRAIVVLKSGKVDYGAIETIAKEAARRLGGQTISNADATIVYLGSAATCHSSIGHDGGADVIEAVDVSQPVANETRSAVRTECCALERGVESDARELPSCFRRPRCEVTRAIARQDDLAVRSVGHRQNTWLSLLPQFADAFASGTR